MEHLNFDFAELMKRNPLECENELVFTDDEIRFLANTNFDEFEERFPFDAEYYLNIMKN